MKLGECNYDILFAHSDNSEVGEIVKISVLILFGWFYCIFSEFNCLLPFPSLDSISAAACDWNTFFLLSHSLISLYISP